MNRIKILIVEDEILIADYIREILVEEGYIHISMAHSSVEAREKIATVLPDIILMDINLEGSMEGIDLSKQKNEDASVIFITGQGDSKTIHEALAVSPESYLSKPIRKVELLTALRIVIDKKKKKYIFVKEGYDEIKLILNDIIYIKSDKNYIDIITYDKKISIRTTLHEFCKELPIFFKQIHRSIIVNTQFIQKVSASEVTVKGIQLPISRKFRKDINVH